jgi:glycosyltransferase involved in cell wall biosynthesis
MISLSLIVPCYNEEINLQKGVLDKIGNYIEKRAEFKEVLIIDDGSTDKSKQIIKNKYLPLFSKFKLIENEHKGKAMAIITGILKATGSYVMFSDIDLATPIEESEKLIKAAIQNYKIVIGSRELKRAGAPISRKIMAFGAMVVRDLIIGLRGVKDTQCGFKLFQKKAAEKIIKKLKVYKERESVKRSSVSAGFDIEFLFVAKKMGYEIKEVPVSWKHVETKNVHFLNDSIEALKDILKIKYLDIKKEYNK